MALERPLSLSVRAGFGALRPRVPAGVCRGKPSRFRRSRASRSNGYWLRALACAALLLAVSTTAGAHHAAVVRSEPAANTRLGALPSEVRAWFTMPVVVPGTGLRVTDGAGRRVDDEAPRRDPGDPRTVSVRLIDPRPGSYTVLWSVVAEADLDFAQGHFGFEVGGGGADWRRKGLLALGMGLLVYGMLRSAAQGLPRQD